MDLVLMIGTANENVLGGPTTGIFYAFCALFLWCLRKTVLNDWFMSTMGTSRSLGLVLLNRYFHEIEIQ
jgi:hypothetical protein